MQNVKLIIFSILLSTILAHWCDAESLPNELTVACRHNDHYPYQGKQNGQVKGLYIETIHEAAKSLGVTITFLPFPWKRSKYSVDNGIVDAICGVPKTENRMRMLYFAEEPLGFEEIAFFKIKDKDIKYSGKIEHLYNNKVAFIRGNTFGNTWEAAKGNFKRLTKVKSFDSLIKMLSLQRVDLIVGNKLIIQYKAKELKLSGQIQSLYPSIQYNARYLAFSKAKGQTHKKLAEEFTTSLKQFKTSAKYEQLIEKYADFD